MRPLIVLIAGVLFLSACGSGSILSDDAEEQIQVAGESTNEDDAYPAVPTEDPDDPAQAGADDSIVLDSEVANAEPDEVATTLVTNPPKPTPSRTTTTIVTASLGGDAPVDPGLLPLVEQAKADLGGRLGVETGAITLVGAELVEWPDASLGCPQPGMVYQQVPSDGSLIVLSQSGVEYRYHTGGAQYVPFLCE